VYDVRVSRAYKAKAPNSNLSSRLTVVSASENTGTAVKTKATNSEMLPHIVVRATVGCVQNTHTQTLRITHWFLNAYTHTHTHSGCRTHVRIRKLPSTQTSVCVFLLYGVELLRNDRVTCAWDRDEIIRVPVFLST